eukprot:9100213-Ditylum_brightwellii.AAC.1
MVVDAMTRECNSSLRGDVAVVKVSGWKGEMGWGGTRGEGDRKWECILQPHALTSGWREWAVKDKTRCSRRERMVDSIIPG